MSLCTPLILCCALAAAPGEPPRDKKDAADKYSARLAAATAIDDSVAKAAALLAIAIESSEAGQDDVVKKCMAAYPKEVKMGGGADGGLCSLIEQLAGAGHEAEAVEAARALSVPAFRNAALASIAAPPATGNIPFWRACKKGDGAAIALFGNAGLNVKDKDGETGLMKAAANGHVAAVKQLLSSAFIEIWEVDKQGRTALMKAAENGQDAVVRAILDHYTNPPNRYPPDEPLNLTDVHGQTALMLAAANGHAGVVRVLLDVRFADPKNARLLTIAPAEGPAVAAPFEAALVDRDRKDNDSKTALDLAEAGKHAGVIELLKKAGK